MNRRATQVRRQDGERKRPRARPCRNGTPVMLALLSALVAAPAHAQSPDERAVVAVVQDFFDAIATKDAELGARAVLPDARIQRLLEAPDGTLSHGDASTGQAFAQALPQMPGQMLERMWDPVVLIRGPLATVWTPYDFWVDGEFSHCGVDQFTLVREEAGWRIAGITYTVEREGCEPSPLGPPG